MIRALAIGLTMVLFLAMGCEESLPPVEEPESRPIKTLLISNSNQPVLRAFPATLEAGDKAVLAFRVSGVIDQLEVLAGQRVERGELLARINPDELQLLEAQAQANYNLAYVQFSRDKELLRTNVVSELQYDTSQANLSEAKAALDQAKTNRSYATILAPYNGNISLTMVENHQYVMAQEPIMHIQSEELINVVFQLPESLLSRFNRTKAVGNATVRLDTFPTESYQATFKEIDTEIANNNASYKVTMVMEKPAGRNILPGMAGTITIELPKTTNTLIPPTAIFVQDGQDYVWRVNNSGQVEAVAITLDADGRIMTGLMDGDLIAVSGVNELVADQQVFPWVRERGI
uniref:efflux RND transporter periplasmic adaptor subunit n=1 Tax=Thaumasiovibrio occultus TaxID=1891184 RepID=UPI000B35CB90|nr:efflux RND transporter periplasmic adaptor subunit [Thaumasiovibrio occultus]